MVHNLNFLCRCSNVLGPGSISSQLSHQTLGMAPKVPNESRFVHPSNDSVRLDLFLWNNDTCPITYFVVEYKGLRVRITATTLQACAVQRTVTHNCAMRF